jgi:hypothetical protein
MSRALNREGRRRIIQQLFQKSHRRRKSIFLRQKDYSPPDIPLLSELLWPHSTRL